MPMPSMPTIPVHFFYIENGVIGKSFRALCTTVPRAGEIIFPEAGSAKVIVHVVAYRAETIPGLGPTMIPNVFLRELTADEAASVGNF